MSPKKKALLITAGVVVLIALIFTPKSENAETTNNEVKEAQIGDTINTDYFEITVNSASLETWINTGNQFSDLPQSNEYRYLLIDITFKNIDSEGRMLTNGMLYINMNGKEYQFDTPETVMADGYGLLLDQINPMVKKRTKIVYKIPNEVKGAAYYNPCRTDKRITLGNIS